MLRERIVPMVTAAAVGIVSGVYIWNQPLQEHSAKEAMPVKPLPLTTVHTQSSPTQEGYPKETDGESIKRATQTGARPESGVGTKGNGETPGCSR